MKKTELDQKLSDMAFFTLGHARVEEEMESLSGPEWGTMREIRDIVGDAYLSLYDEISAAGYNLTWNYPTLSYVATVRSQPYLLPC